MTDTDWLALADFLDAHANDMRSWTEDEPKFRATAEGLRQLDAITAERDQLRAERTQLTGDSMTDIKMTYAYEAGIEDGKSEAKAEVARLRAAIGDDADYVRHRAREFVSRGDHLGVILHDILDAASLTPTPTRCPTCDSDDPEVCNTDGERHTPVDWDFCCPDAWHNGRDQ